MRNIITLILLIVSGFLVGQNTEYTGSITKNTNNTIFVAPSNDDCTNATSLTVGSVVRRNCK